MITLLGMVTGVFTFAHLFWITVETMSPNSSAYLVRPRGYTELFRDLLALLQYVMQVWIHAHGSPAG